MKNQSETPEEGSSQFRFIADEHLGRLARYLRLCGFDTVFADSLADRKIIDIAISENRIILSRDKVLMSDKKVARGCRIMSERPVIQLSEVIDRYGLREYFRPFSRCTNCNGLLALVNGDEIIDSLPERTRDFYTHFMRCGTCGKIYWEGSHYNRMKKFINDL